MRSSYSSSGIRLLLLLGGATVVLLGRDVFMYQSWSVILLIVQLLVLDMMLKESNIFETPYFRFFYILTGIWFIGALFILMHWPGGNALITMSMVGGAAVYSVRAAKKPTLRFLDFAKWIWVVSIAVSAAFSLWKLPYADILTFLPTGAFFLLMLAYFLAPKDRTREEETEPEDKPIDQL